MGGIPFFLRMLRNFAFRFMENFVDRRKGL